MLCAIARRRPDFTSDIVAGAGAMVQCDSPATTDPTDGPPPLYGTCSDSKSAITISSTPPRWLAAPGPAEAMLTLPLFAREYSTNSFTLPIGRAGLTTSTFGMTATSDTNAKSFSGS